ncbi:MAG: 4Fe-4S ferredoxin [Ignavibacteria bacterium RBG_13_36_8]|nr:MAG: 4Fe-4S ferredoxin [Ignavibacteria bacterium RBG_13_36_8]
MKLWRTPLDADTIQRPEGTINIIIERCKGCCFCIEYCPKDVLMMSESFNKKGYHYPAIVKEGMCVNCNLCANICPEFAIYSLEIGHEESKEPEKKAEKKK